jgi:hypothetical protein
VKRDCCPEPVPGPIVTGHVLATVWAAMGGIVCGECRTGIAWRQPTGWRPC